MLWLALHFPALSLEVFSRASADASSLAIAEKHGNRSWVVTCNESAAVCGVHPGMQASAAQALALGLLVRVRDVQAEEESLAGLAAWAGRFTPSVSLQPPAGLLLEIGSCLRLHHGLDNLLDMMASGLAEMGYACQHACAPTPHGAWLLALGETQAIIREPAQLEQSLSRLSIDLLDQSPAILEGLEKVGVSTLGDCLRLPRAGLARRFGKGLLDELDRVLGKRPEARTFFVPPPSFERRLELPASAHEAEALLFAASRLLPELEGYLRLCHGGVQQLELACRHDHMPDTVVQLGFVQPTQDARRMQLLLRETLARTRLAAPVHTILLNALHILSLESSNGDLFHEQEMEGDGNLLLERLRIRLGKEAVYGLAPATDHRPERAWRQCEAGSEAAALGNLHRPLWLLDKPLPCRDGRLVLKAGPERIQSGWWDGSDVARDYYVAQDQRGARLWVYCDHVSGEWFVHGLFA